MRETRAWWEATAAYFQEEVPREGEIAWGPGIPDDELGMLPDIAGATVVELGCGGGQLGVGIARRDPETVIGVDFSREQLGYATDLAAEAGVSVRLIEGDVRSVPLTGGVADLVVSAYVYQWVPDLAPVFGEVARILDRGGVFVFSIPHPFYGVFDPEHQALDRSYHSPAAIRREEDGIEPEQVIYRRRVSDVHAALRSAGLVIDRLIEPGVTDPSVYVDRWGSVPELMAMVPRTLVIRAVRPSALVGAE